MPSGSMRESMQVTIAMPAWAMPSKPPRSKLVGEGPVGGEQVVEVGHGPKLSGQPRPTSIACLGVDAAGGCAAEQHQGSVAAASSATTAAPTKTAAPAATPARAADARTAGRRTRRRRGRSLHGVVAPQARSWSAPRCRPACRPSARPRRARWRRRGRRRRSRPSRAALTGARARPKPRPPSDQRHGGRPSASSVVGVPRDIQHEPARGQHHPARGDRRPAGSRRMRKPPTHRADRQRDQEPQQHQRGVELGVGVDGGPGEERDVDQRGDQRGADEQAHQQRAPRRRRPQRAARDQRVAARRRWTPEAAAATAGRRAVPRPLGGEHRHLGVGGREGEHDAAERERESSGAGEVGLGELRAQPRTSTSGRRARRQRTAEHAGPRTIATSAERGRASGRRRRRARTLAPGDVA